MKKFIIAICGVMLAGGAIGAVPKRVFNLPIKLNDDKIAEAWGMKDIEKRLDAYYKQFVGPVPAINDVDESAVELFKGFLEGDVRGIFAPNWQFNTKAGTYGERGSNAEGSITPIIAREIYEHGGKFCMTQMQASFGKNTDEFIDYFDDNTGKKRYKCQTICEPGYRGDRCLQQGYDCSQINLNYKNDLNNRENGAFRLLSGYNEGQIKPTVFTYQNVDDASKAMVLGLLEINEHSVVASPVYVIANKNTIQGALSNKDYEKLLCAPGYEPNEDKSDCKFSSYCEQLADLCYGENLDLFDENKNHEWATKTENGKSCKYITCKSGYGLDPTKIDKTCIPCETTRKQGVHPDTGVCKKCDANNEMFNNGNCDPYEPLSKSHLLDGLYNVGKCWMESSPSQYKSCVLCQSDQTYNENSKRCE